MSVLIIVMPVLACLSSTGIEKGVVTGKIGHDKSSKKKAVQVLQTLENLRI